MELLGHVLSICIVFEFMLKKVQELGYNLYVEMVQNSKTWN
jgi:hypothetical protein